MMARESYCLFAWIFERAMCSVACSLIVITRVWPIYYIALIVLCTMAFVHRLKRVAFVDKIFAWLVMVNAICIFTLME